MNALLPCNIHVSTYTKLELTQALSIQKFMFLNPDVVATFVAFSRNSSFCMCRTQVASNLHLHKPGTNLNTSRLLGPQEGKLFFVRWLTLTTRANAASCNQGC